MRFSDDICIFALIFHSAQQVFIFLFANITNIMSQFILSEKKTAQALKAKPVLRRE